MVNRPHLPSPARETGAPTDVLRVANLGVRLDHTPILEDVSFYVRRGTTLAIVGPNGAGKTTLFRVLHLVVPHSAAVGWAVLMRGCFVQQLVVVAELPTILGGLGFGQGDGVFEALLAV